MTAYMITYDLRKSRDYTPLIERLRAWGCISPLESVWLGNLTGTAVNVRDALKALIDGDDGLMVLELTKGAGWGTIGVKEDAVQWLQKNVAP